MLTRDLQIRRCAGFRVRSVEGHLGFVESIQRDKETGELRFLAVRAGRIIVLLVPVDEVEAVLPEQGIVILGAGSSRLVPEFAGDELVLRPDDVTSPLATAV
jgi:hypothetical protein